MAELTRRLQPSDVMDLTAEEAAEPKADAPASECKASESMERNRLAGAAAHVISTGRRSVAADAMHDTSSDSSSSSDDENADERHEADRSESGRSSAEGGTSADRWSGREAGLDLTNENSSDVNGVEDARHALADEPPEKRNRSSTQID